MLYYVLFLRSKWIKVIRWSLWKLNLQRAALRLIKRRQTCFWMSCLFWPAGGTFLLQIFSVMGARFWPWMELQWRAFHRRLHSSIGAMIRSSLTAETRFIKEELMNQWVVVLFMHQLRLLRFSPCVTLNPPNHSPNPHNLSLIKNANESQLGENIKAVVFSQTRDETVAAVVAADQCHSNRHLAVWARIYCSWLNVC